MVTYGNEHAKTNNVLKILATLILPPFGLYLYVYEYHPFDEESPAPCSAYWIKWYLVVAILTICFWIPGVFAAFVLAFLNAMAQTNPGKSM